MISWFKALSVREKGLTVIGILGICFVMGLALTGNLFKTKPRKPRASKSQPSVTSALKNALPLASKPIQPLPRQAVEDLKAILEKPWGRNPFKEIDFGKDANFVAQNADDKGSEQNEFLLTAIMVKGEKKIAIINRSFVQEGDSVHGARLLKIAEGYVILERNGQELSLKMDGSS